MVVFVKKLMYYKYSNDNTHITGITNINMVEKAHQK